jgi:hypothetical protein
LPKTACNSPELCPLFRYIQLKHRPNQLYTDFKAKDVAAPTLSLSDKQLAKMQAAAEAFNQVGLPARSLSARAQGGLYAMRHGLRVHSPLS